MCCESCVEIAFKSFFYFSLLTCVYWRTRFGMGNCRRPSPASLPPHMSEEHATALWKLVLFANMLECTYVYDFFYLQ